MQTLLTEQQLKLNIHQREWFGRAVAYYGRMFETSTSPKGSDWFRVGDVLGLVYRIPNGDRYGWQLRVNGPKSDPIMTGEADSLRECLAEVMSVAFREYLQREMV